MDRTEKSKTPDEQTALRDFLDFHRATLLWKAEGLDQRSAGQRSVPTSELTLAGLLKHLALVEDYWFREVFRGFDQAEEWAGVDWDADPDWEFRTAADDDLNEVISLYRTACARSDEAIAGASLDDLAVKKSRDGESFSLRWIMLHMIEETARHNGHADLLREAIDGATGE